MMHNIFYDIFVSHSHKDKPLVKDFVEQLESWGFSVYVDFKDPALKEKMDRKLADSLRIKIARCHIMLFAISQNTSSSRWMPWELGLAHGTIGRVYIYPLDSQALKCSSEQEYLKLYDHIDPRNAKNFLDSLLTKARKESVSPAMREAMKNIAALTEMNLPNFDKPDVFQEFVTNGPRQMFSEWANELAKASMEKTKK
jgi:hypothetical protein